MAGKPDIRLRNIRQPIPKGYIVGRTSNGNGPPELIPVSDLAQTLAATGSTPPGVSNGINQLTGDVTAGPGSGSQAATIATNAVTTAKILNANVTNAKLANSSVTIGSTSVSLGATVATIAGLTLTSPTLVTPALGTPTSGTLTSCTGLPISTGVSGLAAGIATFLGTPTSANLAAAVTDETGSGALVFGTSPTIATLTLTGNTTIPGSGQLDSSGNLGIGMSSPQVALHLAPTKALRSYNSYTDASNGEWGELTWSSNIFTIGTNKNGTGVARETSYTNGGVEKMRVTATGVGYGTSTPAQPLHVYNTSNVAMMLDQGGSGSAVLALMAKGDGATYLANASTDGWAYQVLGSLDLSLPNVLRLISFTGASPIINGYHFPNGDMVQGGGGGAATNATGGFMMIAWCNGTPTGAPTNAGYGVPLIYDKTNNKLWAYNGAWKSVTLT